MTERDQTTDTSAADAQAEVPDLDVTDESGDTVKGGVPRNENGD